MAAVAADLRRDMNRAIYGPEQLRRMEGRLYEENAVDNLIKLRDSGLLTKDEARLVALEMFPVLKQRLAERALTEAAREGR